MLTDSPPSIPLLRLVTCGSVDDGKSTLIGRLLFDSKGIFEDQLAAVKKATSRYGTTGTELDLALLTDGLKAEREQGITIDVAYRYFSTPKRDFIIADCPGHEQYTRNMATGASTADLAILLIDARHGVVTQTRRHAYIVRLLGIRHVVLAVNKMDLLGWSEERFDQIRRDFEDANTRIGLTDVTAIPLSALTGDNVTQKSDLTPWYDGPTLLEHLETIRVGESLRDGALRMPLQLVSRPDLNFRGYQGTIARGQLRAGDEVLVQPTGTRAVVQQIYDASGTITSAGAGTAITMTLDREIDASRGDLFTHATDPARASRRVVAHLVWFGEAPAELHHPYRIKHNTRLTTAEIKSIRHRVDVNSLESLPAKSLSTNDIALCEIEAARTLAFDSYSECPGTGSFILIDRLTHNTVAAGMIEYDAASRGRSGPVSADERAARLRQKAGAISLVGDGAACRATAVTLERLLFSHGHLAGIVDDPSRPTRLAVVHALCRCGLLAIVIGEVQSAFVVHAVGSDDDPNSVALEAFKRIESAGLLAPPDIDFDI